MAGLVVKRVIPKPDNPPEDSRDDSDDDPAPVEPPRTPKSLKTPKSPDHSVQDHEYKIQELQVRREELACRREELRLQAREQELSSKVAMARLQLAAKQEGIDIPISMHSEFDIAKNIRLVPPFNERDVDCYFVHFERVATSLFWPRSVWPLLLQCVLLASNAECGGGQ